jgi:hypothetical protein
VNPASDAMKQFKVRGIALDFLSVPSRALGPIPILTLEGCHRTYWGVVG